MKKLGLTAILFATSLSAYANELPKECVNFIEVATEFERNKGTSEQEIAKRVADAKVGLQNAVKKEGLANTIKACEFFTQAIQSQMNK